MLFSLILLPMGLSSIVNARIMSPNHRRQANAPPASPPQAPQAPQSPPSSIASPPASASSPPNTNPSFSSSPGTSLPWQPIPARQQTPDNRFHTPNTAARIGEPADSPGAIGPSIYNARKIDIPFRRLHQGNLKYFKAGELNTVDKTMDEWMPGTNDYANQSACGVPDSAYQASKVAIHPYWLKFAPEGLGLKRFCMQDVCINWIRADWQNDMINKVTDICCTDINDPSCCHSPSDIKIDRTKAKVLYDKQNEDPEITGDQYPEVANWIFSKCWDEALVEPAYAQNWWGKPPMPNNENGWQGRVDTEQWKNNQASYPGMGWPTYPMGGYMNHEVQNVSDWQVGDATPSWRPVAGGMGFGLGGAGGSGGGVGGGNGTGSAGPVGSPTAQLV